MTPARDLPKRSLFSVALGNLAISAVGSILTYLSFVLVAYMFGATAQTDVFVFASGFVVVVAALITTVFSAVFLPLYIRLVHAGGQARAGAFANAFLFYLAILSVCGAVIILFFPVHLFAVVSRFNLELLADNERILRYFSIVFALTVLNDYLRVLLQAKEAFVPAAQSIVLQPAVNVLGVWAMASIVGYESLAISAAASRIVQFAFLLWRMKTVGCLPRPQLGAKSDMVEFLRVVKPFWLASIISMMSVFFFDYVASGLPAGQLTALVFAQKIYTLPIALLALPVIEVLNTRLSMLASSEQMDALGALYAVAVKVAMVVMVPLSVLMAFNSQEITSVLLGRGKYSAESLAITAHALQVFSLVIPCIVLFTINGRVSLALHKTKMPSLFGSLGHLAMMGAVFVAVALFGYIGLPAAKLLVEVLYFLPFGFIIVWVYLPQAPIRSVFGELSKVIVASAISLLVVWGVLPLISFVVSVPLLYLVFSCSLFLLVFIPLCLLIRLDSVALFTHWVLRRSVQ
ncbi:murein biosynthesis integral membrane protein MurJ [Metapseudomonas otitidis]|uniref:murein biosynthesis integral membrane protein MurJ n=1 Tax=Metapseudomonas otitidis TaxID=319939 RepID=UPI0013F60607|nr:lipid II flippase MurJ [Pseudomonas otitidis]